jgi:ribonuclease J
LKIVPLNSKIKLGDFEIDFVTLTHSILEPNGLSIKTPLGTILHTGDWKIDPNPLIGNKIDEDKLKKIGDEGVSAMICDSTNIFSPGRAGSESDVRDSLLRIMESKTKRILVTSFASNVARMESIFFCAKKTGRAICLVGRSMHRIYKAAKKCGYLKGLIEPLEPREAKKVAKNKILYLATGSQGEPMGAMNRIVNGSHPEVFLEEKDCVIFSSKIIPGNEKKLYNLQNQIVRNNIEIISEENAFVHVSGHPNRDDLKDMYKWVKPKSVIPVHGEHRHMQEHVNFAKEMQVPKTLLIENGDIIKLLPGNTPEVIDKAPSGRVYLDGSINVETDAQSIKDRKNLSINGYLEITLLVSNNGKIKKPIISFKGIPEKENSEHFVFDMEDEIFNICRTFSLDNKNQQKNLIETIKQNCRRIVREKTGKKPFTNINIARI